MQDAIGIAAVRHRIGSRHTPSLRSASRTSNRPPSEDWGPSKSTVSFLRLEDQTEAAYRSSWRQWRGGCTRRLVWTTIAYVSRGFLATAVTQNSPLVHDPG
jgi:hypothetical protein